MLKCKPHCPTGSAVIEQENSTPPIDY